MEINERVNEGMANQFNQSLHFAETKANEERLNEEPAALTGLISLHIVSFNHFINFIEINCVN